MSAVETDMRVYGNYIIEKLIALKDANKSQLTRNEIDTLNDAANLIEHNLSELKRV